MDFTTFANSISSSHAIPPIHPYRLQPSPFPLHLPFSNLKRSGLVKNRLISRCTSKSDEFGSVNGLQFTPNKLFMEEAIGAEYGEGFETFRADGPLKVDVDYLNEKLQDGFLQRIRYAMKPDEAYGLIFSWDNVVAGTRALKRKAWEQLAFEEGKVIPKEGDMHKLLFYAGADYVLHKFFLSDKAENELSRLKLRFSQIYYDNLVRLEKPMDGLNDWLEAVYTARIPCAVVSSLDRRNMLEALERMGLCKYFQAIVTEEDGMESIAHRFLSAAVKLKALGIDNILGFDWPASLSAEAMIRALEILYSLRVLDDDAKLTSPTGFQVAEIPLDPMVSKMIIASSQLGCSEEIITIAAVLSVQSIWISGRGIQKESHEAKLRFAAADVHYSNFPCCYLFIG